MSSEHRGLSNGEERAIRESQAEEFVDEILVPAYENYRKIIGYPLTNELAGLNELLFQHYKSSKGDVLFDRVDVWRVSLKSSFEERGKGKPTSFYYDFNKSVQYWLDIHERAEKGSGEFLSVLPIDVELRAVQSEISELRRRTRKLKAHIEANKKRAKEEVEESKKQFEERLKDKGLSSDELLSVLISRDN